MKMKKKNFVATCFSFSYDKTISNTFVFLIIRLIIQIQKKIITMSMFGCCTTTCSSWSSGHITNRTMIRPKKVY